MAVSSRNAIKSSFVIFQHSCRPLTSFFNEKQCFFQEKQIPSEQSNVSPSKNVIPESVLLNMFQDLQWKGAYAGVQVNGVFNSENSLSYDTKWQSFQSQTRYLPKMPADFFKKPEISSSFQLLHLPLHELCQKKREMGVRTETSGKEPSDAVYECGRGDKKTKKGKIFKHSHGNRRPSRGKRNRLNREKWEIEGLLPGEPMVPSSVTEKVKKLTDS